MRVGLFSDYYFSKGDGTAMATRLSRIGLSKEGQRATVFCPRLPDQPNESGVVSFKSWPGWLYPGLRLCWPFSSVNLIKVKRQKLDVIHSETPIFVGLFGLWAARRLRIPSVMTVHLDMDFMGSYIFRLPALAAMAVLAAVISKKIDKNFWRMLWPRRVDRTKRRSEDFAWRTMSFTASRADLVICPSQKNYDQIIKYVDSSKVRLVPNGIEVPNLTLSRTTARARLKLGREKFVVIVTARHVKEKRVDMVIRSFAKFSKNRPNALLMILNHGPLTAKLKKLAEQLSLNDQVLFSGLLDNGEVFNYLAAADVFVNSSMCEVISLGVLEAAAIGLPLILCDQRLSEPLEDGRNGYFVKSQTELASALETLYSNRRLLKKFGVASKKRAQTYSLGAHTKSLVAVYQELIGPD